MVAMLPCVITQVATGWDQKNMSLTNCARKTGQSKHLSAKLVLFQEPGANRYLTLNTELESDFWLYTFLKQRTQKNHKLCLYRRLEGKPNTSCHAQRPAREKVGLDGALSNPI